MNNFQDLMVSMDRKDWQRSLQIEGGQYFNKSKAPAKSNNKRTAIDSKINPASFKSVENMRHFVESTTDKFRNKNQERL